MTWYLDCKIYCSALKNNSIVFFKVDEFYHDLIRDYLPIYPADPYTLSRQLYLLYQPLQARVCLR